MVKVKISKRYFAQVGAELIEVDPEHVDLHKDGAAFATSAPVHLYQIRAIVGDPDTGPTASFTGIGGTWDEAEAAIDVQLPNEQS
jgi:hypothetical protein